MLATLEAEEEAGGAVPLHIRRTLPRVNGVLHALQRNINFDGLAASR